MPISGSVKRPFQPSHQARDLSSNISERPGVNSFPAIFSRNVHKICANWGETLTNTRGVFCNACHVKLVKIQCGIIYFISSFFCSFRTRISSLSPTHYPHPINSSPLSIQSLNSIFVVQIAQFHALSCHIFKDVKEACLSVYNTHT
jgi:hypothetical protein